ncbi:MAG: hypothetical protein ACR2MO_08640 [Acidimicrobiales bacterium]
MRITAAAVRSRVAELLAELAATDEGQVVAGVIAYAAKQGLQADSRRM